MPKIASYVFFDIETTGLPHLEGNKTKITELSFVAASRTNLEKTAIGSVPLVNKLTLLLNPQRKIMKKVVEMTGITDDMLKDEPVFKKRAQTMLSFLNDLPKPVCLVAHNGNTFDFKILLAEFHDINLLLPKDLLCVDSLIGFRRLSKENNGIIKKRNNFSFEDSRGSEDWPDLNISNDDFNEIDGLCSSFFTTSILDTSQSSLNSSQSFNNSGIISDSENSSFKLTDLYRRLMNKEVLNAHRAEDDCMMLLECVVAAKDFLTWADKNSKYICDIKPLERHAKL